jgi:hypothetical protein
VRQPVPATAPEHPSATGGDQLSLSPREEIHTAFSSRLYPAGRDFQIFPPGRSEESLDKLLRFYALPSLAGGQQELRLVLAGSVPCRFIHMT